MIIPQSPTRRISVPKARVTVVSTSLSMILQVTQVLLFGKDQQSLITILVIKIYSNIKARAVESQYYHGIIARSEL